MEEKTNESKGIKSLEELQTIYEKNRSNLSEVKNDGDKNNKFYYEPVIKYINEMIQESTVNGDEYLKLLAIKSAIYYEQAKIVLIKQNTTLSIDTLQDGLNLIEEYRLNPRITYLYFRILNQLAYLLGKHEFLSRAKELLEHSEKTYLQIDSKNDILIFNTSDLFNNARLEKNINTEKFEKLITNNFQIQAWIYNKLNFTNKFLEYHHTVLRRQLETQDGNAFVWVFKCARFGSYFFGTNQFREARHQLAAAFAVLRDYEMDILKHRTETQFHPEWNNLQKYYADLGKHWIKYGLSLFEASHQSYSSSSPDDAINKLLITSFDNDLKQTENIESQNQPSNETDRHNTNENKINQDKENVLDKVEENVNKEAQETENNNDEEEKVILEKKLEQDETNSTHFEHKNMENLEIKIESNYSFIYPTLKLQDIEEQVSANLIKTKNEARTLFLYIQEWLKRSKTFYNIQDYTIEHVNLILDLNELYKYLSWYETDIDSKYNVQKRRVDLLDMLNSNMRELKPHHYLAINIELLNELTLAQIEVIDLNIKRLCNISPESCLHREEPMRKMEALAEIRNRLTRTRSKLNGSELN